MLEPLMGLVSPSGPQARLSILIFHRVTPEPDPMFPGEVDAQRFDAICTWMRKWANVLPLSEAVGRLRNGTLPARALCITFDDGYADNHDQALPILRKHGLNATFFVASGFLNGGCMWNDRVAEAVRAFKGDVLDLPAHFGPGCERFETGNWQSRQRAVGQLLNALKHMAPAARLERADAVVRAAGVALPNALMMTSQQVAGLARAGMLIGGHTVNHPILARLSETEALGEMMDGKTALESITQSPVDLFAYPNGRPDDDYTARDVALAARAGFKAAVSTAWGVSQARSDIFQLPRFTPWDRSGLRFGLRLALNARNPVRVCQAMAVS